MLIKKELGTIPLLSIPKVNGNNKAEYVTASEIVSLPRSGAVLVADVYKRKDDTLFARFFSDGINYTCCAKWPAESWTLENPACYYYGYRNNYSRYEDTQQAEQFLGKKEKESWRSQGVLAVIDAFISDLNAERRLQAQHRKEELQEAHFAMFPELPTDLDVFCEETVFEFGYIFFGKLTKTGRRYGVCGHCGKNFRLPRDVKQNQQTVCPKCGRASLYKAKWRTPGIEDTAKICVAANVEGQLLLRWMHINRLFTASNGNRQYRFTDYAYNLYLCDKSGRKTIYAYGVTPVPYYGCSDWKRFRNGTQNFSDTYVYTNNLGEVFGSNYYNVDLQAGLAGMKSPICFTALLNNLKDTPEAEYLFKMKLPLLAAAAGVLSRSKSQDKNGFSQLLGVSKQLLPLYQKMCVSYDEHMQIKAYGKWISEEEFLQYRNLRMTHHEHYEARPVLEKMSFGKFVRYFNKQVNVTKRKMHFLLIQYEDYLNMAKDMGIDISRKSLRYPDNICQEHDAVLVEFNKLKFEKENEAFVNAVKPIYAALPVQSFSNGQFSIVLPQLRSDLTAEGQSLGHCVGGSHYSDDHMKGTRMIFFVRRTEKIDKPYFTLQIDMEKGFIIQLHGRGNCNAPVEVRKFAESYLKAIIPARTKNNRRKTA